MSVVGIVSPASCDPFNHPAKFSRLDLGQSWKRTGGWPLEEILVLHHGEIRERGSHRELLGQRGLYERLYQLQLSGQETRKIA